LSSGRVGDGGQEPASWSYTVEFGDPSQPCNKSGLPTGQLQRSAPHRPTRAADLAPVPESSCPIQSKHRNERPGFVPHPILQQRSRVSSGSITIEKTDGIFLSPQTSLIDFCLPSSRPLHRREPGANGCGEGVIESGPAGPVSAASSYLEVIVSGCRAAPRSRSHSLCTSSKSPGRKTSLASLSVSDSDASRRGTWNPG
jgi:hypothetical protein